MDICSQCGKPGIYLYSSISRVKWISLFFPPSSPKQITRTLNLIFFKNICFPFYLFHGAFSFFPLFKIFNTSSNLITNPFLQIRSAYTYLGSLNFISYVRRIGKSGTSEKNFLTFAFPQA